MNDDEDFEEENNILILNDDEGNEVKFELLDMINYEDEDYVVLLPMIEDGAEESEEDNEVVILKLEETDEDEDASYVSVDNEELLETIFEIFKEKFKDEFNFED